MNWLLWIGIGLLVYGAWIWFQRNRPTSPLLYDDALVELYTAIQTIKNEFISVENTSAVLPTDSKRMMLSYIYQGQQLDDRHIYIHNISLTIPEDASEVLRWNDDTQKKIAQFVCAVLDAPTDPTVHKAQNAILSINFLLPSQELHEDFVASKVPDLISLDGLNTSKFSITIEDMSGNIEPKKNIDETTEFEPSDSKNLTDTDTEASEVDSATSVTV